MSRTAPGLSYAGAVHVNRAVLERTSIAPRQPARLTRPTPDPSRPSIAGCGLRSSLLAQIRPQPRYVARCCCPPYPRAPDLRRCPHSDLVGGEATRARSAAGQGDGARTCGLLPACRPDTALNRRAIQSLRHLRQVDDTAATRYGAGGDLFSHSESHPGPPEVALWINGIQ
jgi:hypothetical protein